MFCMNWCRIKMMIECITAFFGYKMGVAAIAEFNSIGYAVYNNNEFTAFS